MIEINVFDGRLYKYIIFVCYIWAIISYVMDRKKIDLIVRYMLKDKVDCKLMPLNLKQKEYKLSHIVHSLMKK